MGRQCKLELWRFREHRIPCYTCNTPLTPVSLCPCHLSALDSLRKWYPRPGHPVASLPKKLKGSSAGEAESQGLCVFGNFQMPFDLSQVGLEGFSSLTLALPHIPLLNVRMMKVVDWQVEGRRSLIFWLVKRPWIIIFGVHIADTSYFFLLKFIYFLLHSQWHASLWGGLRVREASPVSSMWAVEKSWCTIHSQTTGHFTVALWGVLSQIFTILGPNSHHREVLAYGQ